MKAVIALLFAAEVALLFAYYRARRASAGRPRWWLHEAMLAWQTFYWIGALAALWSLPSEATTRFVVIATLAQLSFTIGCVVASARPATVAEEAVALTSGEARLATIVALFSALVCAAFVYSVLQNEDLGLILAGVLTGDEEFISYRVVMSSGNAAYLAPGYVKQFRDVLLLGALLALVLRTPRPRWIAIAGMGLLGLAAAVLSGERLVLMLYVYAFGLAVLLRSGRSAITRRTVVAVTVVGAIAAFVGATYLLGRTTADASLPAIIGESLWGLFDRISLTVPRENATGFPMWSTIAPTWGRSWASELSGILPGVQTSFSSELHALLGGGALGNSPLGMSSDLFLDWGMIGVVLMPFVYVLMLARIDRLLLASPSALVRTARLTAVPLTFSWYSPFLFILNGGLIVVVVALIASTRSRRG